MKKILTTLTLAVSGLIFAQVGINAGETSEGAPVQIAPDAVFHVENASSSQHKGVLLPAVELTSETDQTTTSNGTVTTGLMVWNTGNGGLTPAGYYYWNGTKWVLTGNDGNSDNLYSTNGTLSEDRTVSQDDHNVTYTTGTGKFIIDGTSNLNGGSYVNTTIVGSGEATYTATPQDYYISVHSTESEVLIYVPEPSEDSKGRVFIISNKGAKSVVILKPDGTQALNTTQQGTVPKGRAQWIVCDGTKWFNLINY